MTGGVAGGGVVAGARNTSSSGPCRSGSRTGAGEEGRVKTGGRAPVSGRVLLSCWAAAGVARMDSASAMWTATAVEGNGPIML